MTSSPTHDPVEGIDMAQELRAAHGHVLMPGRYLGAQEIVDDGVVVLEKKAVLPAGYYVQMNGAQEVDAAIREQLKVLGHGD